MFSEHFKISLEHTRERQIKSDFYIMITEKYIQNLLFLCAISLKYIGDNNSTQLSILCKSQKLLSLYNPSSRFTIISNNFLLVACNLLQSPFPSIYSVSIKFSKLPFLIISHRDVNCRLLRINAFIFLMASCQFVRYVYGVLIFLLQNYDSVETNFVFICGEVIYHSMFYSRIKKKIFTPSKVIKLLGPLLSVKDYGKRKTLLTIENNKATGIQKTDDWH